MSEQDISVVVPAFMSASYLMRTLESVGVQTVRPREIVVVDDGSRDGTADVAEAFARSQRGFPVRVLREPHRGPGAARNAGVRAAAGEWIAFLDSDDLWNPDKLAVVTAAMNAHPAANFFCHNETIVFLDGSTRDTDYAEGYDPRQPLPPQLYRRNFFSTSAVVCRRDDVLRCGGFDETLSSAQDYELWMRMSPVIVPVFIPRTLGTYVLRSGNITTSRFWRRLRNALRVKVRHRDKASLTAFAIESTKLTVLHLARPPVAAVRRMVNGRRSA
jgi:glycosyltransferase involved in cell wall biosynthesis